MEADGCETGGSGVGHGVGPIAQWCAHGSVRGGGANLSETGRTGEASNPHS
jgi:hypothetical protein